MNSDKEEIDRLHKVVGQLSRNNQRLVNRLGTQRRKYKKALRQKDRALAKGKRDINPLGHVND